MRLINFAHGNGSSVGAVTAKGVVDFGRLHADVHDVVALLRADLLPAARELVAKRESAPDHALADVRLLNPAGRGLRYFCIGVNYPERNEEYKDNSASPKYPSLFMRTHASFSAPGEPVLRPRESEQFDYEGEIVLVIGKSGRRIAQADAMEHVIGYSVANEGSVRDWLRHSKFNVTQGKNFDRSGSIGPWIVTADEVGSEPLRVTTKVNGELRQDDTSDRMLFSFSYLVHYLSTFCALESGDIILTGTPSGAGARMDPPRWLRAGDVVEVEVSRVGMLRNEVLDD